MNDSLFRISLKALITNDQGQVLCVKETGRTAWDLPGGGMEHGETIKTALARELKEEIGLTGDFTYTVLAVDEPQLLATRNIHQIRLIFKVLPVKFPTQKGPDADEVAYLDPTQFENSEHLPEQRIYEYWRKQQ